MEPNFGTLWWRHYVRLSGTQCVYCLRFVSWEKLTRDHLKPRCRGGADGPWNVVPACAKCNKRKGNVTAAEFLASPRRIQPAADAVPHPLGCFDERGNFRFSAAARQVQQDERARRQLGSRSTHRRPYFRIQSELAAAIENLALPPHRQPETLPARCAA